MIRIHAVARVAARNSRTQALPLWERYEAAIEGVAIAFAHDPDASTTDLVQAGIRAIDVEMLDWMRHNGRNNTRAFQKYWSPQPPFPADAAVGPIAVRQVLAALPNIHQATLLTLAATGSVAATAVALGVVYETAARRIRTARAAFLALWWEGYAPPRMRTDRATGSYTVPRRTHCKRGHEFTPENRYYFRAGGYTCRQCQLQRQRNRRSAEQLAG